MFLFIVIATLQHFVPAPSLSCDSSATTCTLDCTSSTCGSQDIHCPTAPDCESCTINCESDNGACAYSTVYGHECDNVTINSQREAGLRESIIYGPIDGNLAIHCYDAGKSNECDTLNVNASLSSHLEFYCYDNSDCIGSSFICPNGENVETSSQGPSCVIDCSQLTSGVDKCTSLSITTINGIPRDLDFICNDDVCTMYVCCKYII